jgi:hypothetical protein
VGRCVEYLCVIIPSILSIGLGFWGGVDPGWPPGDGPALVKLASKYLQSSSKVYFSLFGTVECACS